MHDPATPMIRFRNIEKCFKTKAGFTYVLRRITLDIADGEFLTIMGPSGAGKSTLLGLLGMYDHSWQGEFQFPEYPVHWLRPKERAMLNKRHIGFVFQHFHLLDGLTVAGNLDVPLSYLNIPKSERHALMADALDRFSSLAKKDLYPSQLSGGQQQLVAVARAIIATLNHGRPTDKPPSKPCAPSVPGLRAPRLERAQFISRGEGCLAELETQLRLAMDLHFCQQQEAAPLLQGIEEERKMLNGLRRSLLAPRSPPPTRHSSLVTRH